MAELHIPTDQEFTAEVTRASDDVDSLMLGMLSADDVFTETLGTPGDDLESGISDENLRAILELPERERRLVLMNLLLQAGEDFETTIFGIPVVISPLEDSPEPPRPDDAGDRQPRSPIPPAPVDAISAEVA